MSKQATLTASSELSRKASELYAKLRSRVETPDNIGKLIVMDVESGDFEIDDQGIESSRRLQQKHPSADLFALRIGYDAVEVLGGILERTNT